MHAFNLQLCIQNRVQYGLVKRNFNSVGEKTFLPVCLIYKHCGGWTRPLIVCALKVPKGRLGVSLPLQSFIYLKFWKRRTRHWTRTEEEITN